MIILGWNVRKDKAWILAGWDLCGTRVRDWEIGPNESVDLLIHLAPEFKEQQILGRFYRAGQPSVQSDCLLYEKS
jgi:hypothetical protein